MTEVISKAGLLDKKKLQVIEREVEGVTVRVRKMVVADMLSEDLLQLPIVVEIFDEAKNTPGKKPDMAALLLAIVGNRDALAITRKNVCLACLVEPALSEEEFDSLDPAFKDALYTAIMELSGHTADSRPFFRSAS